MTGAEKRKAFLPERGCAWAVTLLLTLFLTVTILSALGMQALTSTGLHVQAATDNGILDEQLRSIHAYIGILAEDYGFAAEPVKETVGREQLKEMNQKAAAWWTCLFTEGKMDSFPRWYSGDIEDAVYAAMAESGSAQDPQEVVSDLTDMIERTVFPMRESLLTIGMNLAGNKADLPGILHSLRSIPLLGLAMSLLTAGLIALLLGREILRSLKHYGTAIAGTGFIVLAASLMIMGTQMKEVVGQASRGLAGKLGILMNRIGLETGAIILGLLGIGYFCLYLYRNRAGKRENTNMDMVRAE